ncbi:MAG: hypothetical protein Q7T86_07105 [Hyphomicrobiaceae bacterium]|jgi:hypothetical protein|nr:hypothetical protein [Hyphomicrobiaceae bacterium]
MARDAKGSARILSVQQQLRKIEEAKLGELQRKLQGIKDEQVALVSAMNDDGALQNLFLGTMALRLKTLAEHEKRADIAVNWQSVAVREEATKEKTAERLAKRRADEEQAKQTQKELDDILELLAHPRDASLR